jgi:hypothetical protein
MLSYIEEVQTNILLIYFNIHYSNIAKYYYTAVF